MTAQSWPELRRSSSAWAKYALALRRISLACRSFPRFSRSRAFSFVATIRGNTSAAYHCRARPSSPTSCSEICAVQPILAATRRDRRPARGGVLAFVIQNHSHRAGADLGRELVGRLACHGSTFSGVGASDQPGAVQAWRKGIAGQITPGATGAQQIEDRVHRRTHVGLARSVRLSWPGGSATPTAPSLGNPLPDCLCASRCSLVHIPNHLLPILAETVNHAAVDNSRTFGSGSKSPSGNILNRRNHL